MKHYLLVIIICLISISSSGQKKIEAFLTIKFGTTKEVASQVIKGKGGVLDVKNSTTTSRIYTNLKFGSRATEFVIFRFHENKFYDGVACFAPDADPQVLDLYEDIKSELDEIYGTGREVADFKSPYEKGDGHEHTAIKLGYGKYVCFWSTKMPNGRDNYIALEITKELNVTLRYQDSELMEQYVSEAKKKTQNDY